MSFELTYVVSLDKTPPSAARIEQVVAKLPYTTKQEQPGEFLWHYEYLNPETGVVASFRCKEPDPDTTAYRGMRDAGLKCIVPFLCPTFVAREALPMVEQVGRALNLAVISPSGEVVADADAGRLQIIWTDGNRKTLERFGVAQGEMPPYFPRERLDEMWRYMNARHTLDTRYSAKGIYVPRIVLIRNKLDRRKINMACMWTEIAPAVFPPEVDAFVIGKPIKTLFGLLNSGEVEPVVVRGDAVYRHVTPLLRMVDRPIPHRLLEDVSKVKGPILKDMGKVLCSPFLTYETVAIEEVVDVQV